MEKDSNVSQACNCLPTCSSLSFTYNFDIEKFNNQDPKYVNRSMTTFYFADDEFIVYKRSASFGNVDLIANIGGLLGLFLGISILSVVEIFVFFVVRVISWKKNLKS